MRSSEKKDEGKQNRYLNFKIAKKSIAVESKDRINIMIKEEKK